MRKTGFWLVALALAVAPCLAEEMEFDAQFAFVNSPEVVAELEGGMAAWQVKQRGFVVQTDPDHPMHMANQDCYGELVGTNETFEGAGYCIMVDKNMSGAVWVSWVGTQEGGTWSVLHGTGAYAGAKGGGRYSLEGSSWPDGKAFTSVKGSIEIP